MAKASRLTFPMFVNIYVSLAGPESRQRSKCACEGSKAVQYLYEAHEAYTRCGQLSTEFLSHSGAVKLINLTTVRFIVQIQSIEYHQP